MEKESISTEETELNESNDGQSVVSESLSLSKLNRKSETKKLLVQLQRLKQENLSLRESLQSSDAQEVSLLKIKLRECNSDLARLRQLNGELKDRIQMLEGKIFDSLQTEVAEVEELPKLETLSISEKLKQRRRERETASSTSSHKSNDLGLLTGVAKAGTQIKEPVVVSLSTKSGGELQALANRCKYLERLNKSYEKRMELMQEELTAKRPSTADTSTARNVDFQAAPKDSKPIDDRDEAAMIANKKMIAELAAEVKRLTSLLPRRLINESEGQELPDELDSRNDEYSSRRSRQGIKRLISQEVQTVESSDSKQRLSLSVIALSLSTFFLGCAVTLGIFLAYKPVVFNEVYSQFLKEKN